MNVLVFDAQEGQQIIILRNVRPFLMPTWTHIQWIQEACFLGRKVDHSSLYNVQVMTK